MTPTRRVHGPDDLRDIAEQTRNAGDFAGLEWIVDIITV